MLFLTVEKIENFQIHQQVKEMIDSFLNFSTKEIAKFESLENAILLEKEINSGYESAWGPGIIRVSERLLILMITDSYVHFYTCL